MSRLISASATVHYLICKNLRIVSNRPTEVPLTKDHSHSLLSFQVITTNYALKGSYMTLISEELFSLSVSFGNYRQLMFEVRTECGPCAPNALAWEAAPWCSSSLGWLTCSTVQQSAWVSPTAEWVASCEIQGNAGTHCPHWRAK